MKQKNIKVRAAVIFVLGAAIAIIIAASASAMIDHPALAPLSKNIQKKVYVVKASTPYLGTDFTLTDQRGNQISLSQLRGKTVVLTFMDPHCQDICLMVSHEFVMAARHLGMQAGNVAFVAVNVNAEYNKVSDVLDFSQQEGLSGLPNWHFVTGSPAALKNVWQAYGISVAPGKDGEVQHAAVIYFIDPSGKIRFRAHSSFDRSSIAAWSKAIAHYTKLTAYE